jgi:hypothetical protein
MLLWIFQQIVISLVVIALVHSIYTFLQNNLTTPKVRDLVNKPTKKYEEIYKTFEAGDPNKSPEEDLKRSDSSMKNELQNYLKELSQNTTVTSQIKPKKQNNIPEAIMSFSDNFTNSYQTI